MEDLELLLSLQQEDQTHSSGEECRNADGFRDKPSDAVSSDQVPGYCSDDEEPRSRPLPNMSAFKDVLKSSESLPKRAPVNQQKKPVQRPSLHGGGDVEVHSGLRIKNRVIDSMVLTSKLADTRFLRLQALKFALVGDTIKGAWATMGVVVDKTPPKVASNGKNYAVWKLTALDNNIISLFLFGDAYREHWKESVGCVVTIVNASVRKDDKRNDFSLSIFNVNQLLVVGTSADYAVCRGKKKDGTPCTIPVNTKQCSYCKYHASAAHLSVQTLRPELSGGNLAAGLVGPLKSRGINPVKRVVEESMVKEPVKRVKHRSASDLSRLLSDADKMTTRTSSQGLKFLASMAENKAVSKSGDGQQKVQVSEKKQRSKIKRPPLKEMPNSSLKDKGGLSGDKQTRSSSKPAEATSTQQGVEIVELDFGAEDGSDDMAQALSIFSKKSVSS